MHRAKARSAIFVTDSGIIVDLKPAIRVFVSVSIMALQPSRESYLGLSSATTILSSDAQPRKTVDISSVTNLGITMLLSEVQPSKAESPILVTDSGIVILSSEAQPEKAFPLISVTDSGIVILLSEVQPSKVHFSIFVTP